MFTLFIAPTPIMQYKYVCICVKKIHNRTRKLSAVPAFTKSYKIKISEIIS